MTIPIIEDDKGRKYSYFIPFKKGGMGEIYKGYVENSKEEVVIKLVFISDYTEEELLSRELEACKHFSHKNLVKTYHTGRIAIEGGDYLYIIQKYYPNGNLRTLIKENIPIDQCHTMMSDILLGMREMYKSIVHRDIKPENILIDADGHLVITDFGLAKYIDDKTRTKSFKGSGTIPYMAPECWMGDANTIIMDIYSFGIIFYEILTGRHPYKANNELEWRECHIYKPLPDISAHRAGVNTKIKQIIQKMVAKKVSDRYQNCDEILNAMIEASNMQNPDLQDIERLASMGNSAMQQVNVAKLKDEEEEAKKIEWIKLLNYHIMELFNNVTEKVNAINSQFETGKITIQQGSIDITNTRRNLNLSFNRKGVYFKFSNYEDIERFENNYRDNSIKFQRARYGMVLQSPGKTFFSESNFVLVGIAETSFKLGTSEYGFNLLLKKNQMICMGNGMKWYSQKMPSRLKRVLD
jgi:serine/threonine protein kinase